jgi:hypothetical protein
MEYILYVSILILVRNSGDDRVLSNCYSENGANFSLIFWVSSRSFNQYSQIIYNQDCLKGNEIQRCNCLSPLIRTVSLYLVYCTCITGE